MFRTSKSTGREADLWLPRAWREGTWECVIKCSGTRQWWHWPNIVNIGNAPELHTLKWQIFVLCVCYYNKKRKPRGFLKSHWIRIEGSREQFCCYNFPPFKENDLPEWFIPILETSLWTAIGVSNAMSSNAMWTHLGGHKPLCLIQHLRIVSVKPKIKLFLPSIGDRQDMVLTGLGKMPPRYN